MFCPQCGKQLPDGAKFCAACGASLTRVPTQAAQPVVQPVQAPVPPAVTPPVQSQPIQTPPVQAQPIQTQPVQAPVYPEAPQTPPPAAPDPNPVKESVVRTSPSGGLRVLSFLLCFLLLIMGLCTSLLGAARWELDPDRLYYRVLDLDLSQTTMPDENGESVPLAQYIQQVCKIDFQDEYGIDEAGLNRLLNAEFLKKFVADNLANYTDTLLRDAPLKPLTREKLVDFLRYNDKEIKNLTGFSFVDYEYAGQMDKINEYLDVYSLDGIFNELGTRTLDESFLEENLGMHLDAVKTIFSLWVLLALCGVCLLLLILIFVVLHRYPRSAFGHSGGTLLILGILDLILGAGGMLALKITKLGTLERFANPMLIFLLIVGGALLLLGIVFLLIKGAFKHKA